MDYKKLYEEQMIQNKKLNDECDKYEGVIALTTDLLTQEIEQLKHKVSICEAEQEEEANLYIKLKEENEELQGMLEDTDDDRLIDILGCEHCERVEAVEKLKNDLRLCAEGLIPNDLIQRGIVETCREKVEKLKEENESLKKDFECYKGKYFLSPECQECGVLLTEDDLFASLDCVAGGGLCAPHFCCEGCREEYEDSDED
mgnify:FL=1